jgi:D-aspartate ligase
VFYAILEKHRIPFPQTLTLTYTNRNRELIDAFTYPAVLKPSDSAAYWKYCSFSGMRKVYFVDNGEQAKKIAEKIYSSGYRGKIALQKRIGGTHPKISVLTVFFQNHRAVRSVYGRVILEETGATSHGNHAAIITEKMTPLSLRLIEMMEALGYNGFANFDIISDGEAEYVLEVNLRQGRSCDYMRAAGINMAELLTKSIRNVKIEPSFDVGKIYWRYPPHSTVCALSNENDVIEAELLSARGLEFSPLEYAPDTECSILRKAYVSYHDRRLNKTFMKNARLKG